MIYEYRCTVCKHSTEKEHGMNDRPSYACFCGGMLQRQIGVPAILFKGPGWTPTFHRPEPPPYDPEKDMQSVDAQRKDAGMEPSDWKPKHSVHQKNRVTVK